MKSWTRELLFAAEVPEVKAEAFLDAGGQRVWKSVYAIPPGTLVRPSKGRNLLYVNTRGSGWWVANSARAEIGSVERSGKGWALGSDEERMGPFAEVTL